MSKESQLTGLSVGLAGADMMLSFRIGQIVDQGMEQCKATVFLLGSVSVFSGS